MEISSLRTGSLRNGHAFAVIRRPSINFDVAAMIAARAGLSGCVFSGSPGRLATVQAVKAVQGLKAVQLVPHALRGRNLGASQAASETVYVFLIWAIAGDWPLQS